MAKKEMDSKMEYLFKGILSLNSIEECTAFCEDICTITERKLVVTTDKDGATAEEFTTYLVDTINGLK